MLYGDRVGQDASGDLDAEERRDLTLLGDVDRLGAGKGQAFAIELVPDRRHLPGEQLRHQPECLAHGSLLRDVDRRDSGDPSEFGQRYCRLHEPSVGEHRRDGSVTGRRL